MPSVNVDVDTFKHALTNLNKIEIAQIAQANNISINIKDTKDNIVNSLLDLLKNDEIKEKLYLDIREKAFSINKNFYDGFFYKFDKSLCDFTLEDLIKELKSLAKVDTKRFIEIINDTIDNDVLYFTCEITTSRPVYDSQEERSRYFKNKISADIDVFFNDGLIYIHSKNIADSKKIKTFIQNTFNSKKFSADSSNKVCLSEPTFEMSIAEKWIEGNKEKLSNNYSAFSIHMLDLLNEFSNEDGKFSSLSLKSIFFKHEVIDANNEDASIKELNYGGENLQKHHRIKEELREGKKITGFKFEVTHSYIDEETGDKKYSILPIVILYEKKYALRISICTENVSAKEEILYNAYKDVKELFMNKYRETKIINGESILNYLKEDKNEKPVTSKETVKGKQESWAFNG